MKKKIYNHDELNRWLDDWLAHPEPSWRKPFGRYWWWWASLAAGAFIGWMIARACHLMLPGM